VSTASQPKKDQQTITPDGVSTLPRIHDVTVRRLPPIEDERGEVVEVYRQAWNFHPDPLVFVYQATIRPGKIKGWVVHQKQDDRIFTSRGTMRWALFDNRPDSPTYRVLQVMTISERHRALFNIPRGVYHAVQNIGETEAVFVNLPTRAYDHVDPDKLRLPLQNDLIPFDFGPDPW